MNKQCVWLSDSFSMVCVNGDSEHCADFVDNKICNKCKEYSNGEDIRYVMHLDADK